MLVSSPHVSNILFPMLVIPSSITTFFMFWHSEWFVWVLTVASTLGYRMSILRKNPRIKQAVGVKEKHKQISTRKQLKRMGKATTEKDK